MKRLVPLALSCALLSCGTEDRSASWLTEPTLAGHSARFFPIGPGDVHGPAAGQALTTCNACHADRSSGSAPYPPAASFETFTCTGCHVEIRPGVFHDDIAALGALLTHGNKTVFDPAQPLAYDKACYGCHASGVSVDHAKVFPLPHPNAAATVAACSDCHASQTDRAVLGCAACHPHDQPATATAHAAVPDFVAGTAPAASASCARCHGDSTVPVRVAAHARFPIGAGTTHSGAAGGACLSCHPAVRAAPKAFAADFTQPSCTGCHAQTAAGFHDDGAALATFHTAQGVTGFAFTTADCLRCHPDGTGAGAPSYHPQLFPIGPGSKHDGIACSACHGANRADVAQLQCASCHADRTKSPNFPTQHPTASSIAILVVMTNPPAANCAATPLPALTSADCLKCHALSNVDLVQSPGVHPGGDSGFGKSPHKGAGCLTCHQTTKKITAPVTPAPAGYTTIDFTKPTNPSRTSTAGCVNCHSNGCGGN